MVVADREVERVRRRSSDAERLERRRGGRVVAVGTVGVDRDRRALAVVIGPAATTDSVSPVSGSAAPVSRLLAWPLAVLAAVITVFSSVIFVLSARSADR